jgi:gamma-glutamyltranspeptidase / glutathione hydrolase
MSTRAFRRKSTQNSTYYPRLMGVRGAVATMHYLSAGAARDVLVGGGNAVDAAVAAVLVEGLVNPHMHTIGGECPILVRMADSPHVHVINGNTAAPGRADPQAYLARGLQSVPDEGILGAGVPAALASLLLILGRFGTASFADLASPAIALARSGFPMHRGLLNQEKFGIRDLAEKFRLRWGASAKLYLPDGEVPEEGSIFRNQKFAAVLDFLSNAERAVSGDRQSKLDAVGDCFYRGDIAAAIAKFSRERDGLLERDDLAVYQATLEEPASTTFRNVELFKCGFWTQGPTMLQCLGILGNFELETMGHNSADYLHTLIEAIKLVYADREQYYGDGFGVQVPAIELLRGDYAALRSSLIDTKEALSALVPGDPRAMLAKMPSEQTFGGRDWGHGTVHVDIIDHQGNMVAATPSGAWIKSSEVIPDLGFPLGNRLMTFYLAPKNHPNVVAPYKRPRTTLSPSLATVGGRSWMVFGSMGGDQQDQWQLQFLLNRVVFGMTVQEAIEAPKFSSDHFPGFFSPHDRFPNKVRLEPRMSSNVVDNLRRRGHAIDIGPDWSEGYLLTAAIDPRTNVLEAGCDPRGWKSEIFPMTAMCW